MANTQYPTSIQKPVLTSILLPADIHAVEVTKTERKVRLKLEALLKVIEANPEAAAIFITEGVRTGQLGLRLTEPSISEPIRAVTLQPHHPAEPSDECRAVIVRLRPLSYTFDREKYIINTIPPFISVVVVRIEPRQQRDKIITRQGNANLAKALHLVLAHAAVDEKAGKRRNEATHDTQ